MKSFHGIVQRSLFIVYSDNAGIPGQGTGELLFEECTLDGERVQILRAMSTWRTHKYYELKTLLALIN